MKTEKQKKEDERRCEECLPREQAARLYVHALHEDGMFNARFHSFLVIQTVLLTATGVIQNGPQNASLGRAIPIAALILSLTWAYVQIRQKRKLDVLIRRLEKFLPEFERTRRWTRAPRGLPSATTLLAYAVPASFVGLWGFIAGNSIFGR